MSEMSTGFLKNSWNLIYGSMSFGVLLILLELKKQVQAFWVLYIELGLTGLCPSGSSIEFGLNIWVCVLQGRQQS